MMKFLIDLLLSVILFGTRVVTNVEHVKGRGRGRGEVVERRDRVDAICPHLLISCSGWW